MFVQATIAILILVGFESVTALGGEAKNPKRHIPIAVITSLLIQGAFCYLFEYFAANYFLNSGYTMQSAMGSAAPIGDMMIVVGNQISDRAWTNLHVDRGIHRVPGHHRHHAVLHEYRGARDYAMGRTRKFRITSALHSRNLTPHRAIWTLAAISAIVGFIGVMHPVRRYRRPPMPPSRRCRRASGPASDNHARWDGGHAEFAAHRSLASSFGTFLCSA